MLRRIAPAALAALVFVVACSDLLGPQGDQDNVRLVVRPSFGQVPDIAMSDNPAARVDNVHVLLRNAAGSVTIDEIVEWPLDQDTLRLELDVVVKGTESFDLTIRGRSGEQVLFQAGPVPLSLSDSDGGGAVETTPVLEYAGPGAEVAAVEITGAPTRFLAGAELGLAATGTNSDGSDPGSLIMVWTSLDPDAATVDEDGNVRVGHDATRTVTIEGRVAFTTVTDTIRGPVVPAELAVSPDASTLTALGAELGLTGALLGTDGGDVTGVAIAWTVRDPSVLELDGGDGTAHATALATGSTWVVATAGELADSAQVTVVQTVTRVAVDPGTATFEQMGETLRATAAAFDANDHEIDGTEFDWTTSAEGVVTVADDGLMTAAGPGTAWIVATAADVADSVSATVANGEPEVAITAPSDGATFHESAEITFEGTASDPEDGDLSSAIEWAVAGDELGTGSSVSATLDPGTHAVTATVTDSHGGSASATINVTVGANAPPTVTITAPTEALTVTYGTAVTLAATATDDADGDVADSIRWSSSIDGDLGVGASITASELSTASHTISATVTDSHGATGSATVAVEVLPADGPEVVIASPADNAQYAEGTAITFEASAHDYEDVDISGDLVWTSTRDGETTQIGTGASFTKVLPAGSHQVTARVTDRHGKAGSASRSVTVQGITVSGTVTYSTSGVSDLTVELTSQAESGIAGFGTAASTDGGSEDRSTTTDANGRYEFTAVPDGDYLVRVVQTEEYDGPARNTVVKVRGENITQNFALQKKMTRVAPANAALVGAGPALRWRSFPGAARYKVEVTLDDSPSTVIDSHTPDAPDTAYAVVAALDPGKSYRWTVNAYDSEANWIGASMGTRTLKRGSAVKGRVFYSSDGVGNSKVELRKGSHGGEIAYSVTTGSDGSFTFPAVADDTYHLRVNAPDADTTFTASKSRSVTVAAGDRTENMDLPKKILLKSPAKGNSLSGRPKLEWFGNNKAYSYKVQVNVTEGGDELGQFETADNPSYTLQKRLKDGAGYTWQVDAYDTNSRHVGTTQHPFTFKFQNSAPTVGITTSADSVPYGRQMAMAATIGDAEDDDGDLTVQWFVDDGEEAITTGASTELPTQHLALGKRKVKVKVTDSHGSTATDTFTVDVQDPGLRIETPDAGATLLVGEHTFRAGLAKKDDLGDDFQYVPATNWSYTLEDGTTTQFDNSGHEVKQTLSAGAYTITARIGNSQKMVATITITVTDEQ